MSNAGTRQLSACARIKRSFLVIVLGLVLLVPAARGDDQDLRTLELYDGAGAENVSASRSPRPASQTAENTTVVTAQDIEALNAHTLADILVGVPGVQLEMVRTPGTVANINVQGSNFNHVLVLIDNVPINNLADNYPDISAIPVQMIERVEIVKGAASTAWGSALGGVINVITKNPQTERPFAGMVSGSIGKRTTSDSRAEVSGTLDRLGYLLSGGNLHSDGLLQNNMVIQNSVYGKLRYELPGHGALTLATLYTENSSGQTGFDFSAPDQVTGLPVPSQFTGNQKEHQLVATLGLQYPLTDHFSLDAALRTRNSNQDLNSVTRSLLDNTAQQSTLTDAESSSGGSLGLSWLSDLQRIAAGVDFDHARVHLSMPLFQADLLKRSADRVGVYLNDTVTLGNFAVIPSVRYDHTGAGDDLYSPSLGITYALTENSVLRGYTSRGYSLTSLNRDNATEKVWTSQLGFETGDLPYLWLKGTLFRNDTWNISATVADPDPPGFKTVKQRQLKQGYELEARTLPVFNTSLSAGYTFIHATDPDSDRVLKEIPPHTAVLGMKYQDRDNFRALLSGRYIDWNTGKHQAVIWDLHLGKRILFSEHLALELFLSVRNLLNGGQYLSDVYKNAGRWAEAGVRCNF